jgi:hypothetical protein
MTTSARAATVRRGRLVPRGPLWEFPHLALARADVIALHHNHLAIEADHSFASTASGASKASSGASEASSTSSASKASSEASEAPSGAFEGASGALGAAGGSAAEFEREVPRYSTRVAPVGSMAV